MGPQPVPLTGDVYEKGTETEFYNWYGQDGVLWGRFKDVTNPIVGNHEYENDVAPGYFNYWSGVPDYYSYDANAVVVSSGAVSGGTWVTVPLPAPVTGDGIYDLVLTPRSPTALKLDSRESATPPGLVVTR